MLGSPAALYGYARKEPLARLKKCAPHGLLSGICSVEKWRSLRSCVDRRLPHSGKHQVRVYKRCVFDDSFPREVLLPNILTLTFVYSLLPFFSISCSLEITLISHPNTQRAPVVLHVDLSGEEMRSLIPQVVVSLTAILIAAGVNAQTPA